MLSDHITDTGQHRTLFDSEHAKRIRDKGRMVPRGEVALIFAGIVAALVLEGQPLVSQGVFSALVLMVVLTILATPLGLRWALRRSTGTS